MKPTDSNSSTSPRTGHFLSGLFDSRGPFYLDWLRLIAIAIVAFLFYWVLDATLDYFIFYDGDFRLSLWPSRHEVLMRAEAGIVLASLVLVLGRLLQARARTLEAVSEERRFFHSALDNMGDALVISDPNGQVEFINSAAQRLFLPDPSGGQVTRTSDLFTVIDEESSTANERHSNPGSEATVCERTVRTRQGLKLRVRMATSRYVAHPDATGNRTLLAIQDLTHLKEMERMAEEEKARAITADKNRYLANMAADMAHEMNQPLSGVRGLAEHILLGLERNWDIDEKNMKGKLTTMMDQVDRMTGMIEHVRSLSRKADEREMVASDLNKVVKGALGLCDGRLKAARVTIRLDLDTALPNVPVNPYALEQALYNVIVNALESIGSGDETPAGNPEIQLSTSLDTTGEYDTISIRIADNGCGMEHSTLKNAFDPFFTTRRPGPNVGLGLTMVKSVVTDNGGTIQLDSTPGKGTVVTIIIPVSKGK